MSDLSKPSANPGAGDKWDDSEFHQTETSIWLLRHKRELLIFACLLALAGAVILWLPKIIAPVSVAPASSDAATATRSSSGSPTSTNQIESPWQEAQLAKARREAQEVLAKLLDRQTELEKLQVRLWADTAYSGALQKANQGDELYSQRQFDQAQQRYTAALAQLDELVASAAGHFEQALHNGQAAIELQQPEAAIRHFSLATAISPEDNEAQQGLQRAQVLDQVIEKLDSASNWLAQGDLDTARQQIELALALDPLSEPALALRDKVDQDLTESHFASAMGKGYQHMQQQQYRQAIARFSKALQIEPDSVDAREALKAAKNLDLQGQIQAGLQQASSMEAREQWQQALQTYQRVQTLDNSLVAARVGVLRSQARAQLDERLQHLIAEPLRLSDAGVLREAEQLLADARRVQPQGERIVTQSRLLQQAMAKSQVPVAIRLQSDNKTRVTLYRVGELGSFSEHSVNLKPGQYTVVGSRRGYRDVREQFTVMPDDRTLTIVIQCTEKISLDG